MKTYVVQLENHDDVISSRDKLSRSKASRVLLVWPRRGRVLQRSVDLLLLQRHCQYLGAQLGIVTTDSEVLSNAHDLGIPAFSKADQAQKGNWRRSHIAKSGTSPFIRQVGQRISAQTLREQRAQFHTKPVLNRVLSLSSFTVGIFSFLALVLFFAPGAKITLTPQRETQEISLPVWAEPSIKTVNPSGGMPASAVSAVVEGRSQLASSGHASVPDHFSSGQVILTNLTNEVVDIPAGSIFLTAGAAPIRFRSTNSVQVPAGLGMTQTLPVVAVVPGREGNVAEGQIRSMEGALGLQVVVENSQPLSGGTDLLISAPTRQDAQKLREALLASLEKIAVDEIMSNRDPDQIMLEGSLQLRTVLEEYWDPEQDQPADVLQLTLRVEYEAWFVKEIDVQTIAQAALDANLPENYQSVPQSLNFVLMMQPPTGMAVPSEANFQGQLTAARSIETVWSNNVAIQAVTGHNRIEAISILQDQLDLSAPPVIEISPSWWRFLPFLPARITLVKS